MGFINLCMCIHVCVGVYPLSTSCALCFPVRPAGVQGLEALSSIYASGQQFLKAIAKFYSEISKCIGRSSGQEQEHLDQLLNQYSNGSKARHSNYSLPDTSFEVNPRQQSCPWLALNRCPPVCCPSARLSADIEQ
ncbi:hypothetical protein BDY21DRAFT_147008 [Lineolata rhizophorae]|uniref:Uncharacterized protein n=1 Tax=Lineolata rhizophorae TaxID=578093 RepID=A0A6A6NN23_9PEZI|nr:hypothetical protein BDY21DRAFT_147008 [Lineolata rhizophorae]